MTDSFGSDKNPAGMFNIFGRRPGALKAEPDFQGFSNNYMNIFTYTSTHEAIAQAIPAPLEPITEFPPVVSVVHLQQIDHGTMHAFDDRPTPYRELGFWVPVKYKDNYGTNIPFLYLDGPGVDIAVIGGREVLGHPKCIADIHTVRDGDSFNSTVVRGGRLIVQMEMTVKEETPVEGSLFADMGACLNVKEIPSCDFQGYDVRKIIEHQMGVGSTTHKVWNAEGSITLGGTPNDPVSMLEIVEMGPCFQVWSDSDPGTANISPENVRVVEDLLK